MPACTDGVAALMAGLRLACTGTGSSALAVAPLPSDTVTFTVRVAAARNVCVGFCSADVSPSPKFHAYVSVSLSGSAPVALKATGTPTRTSPVGVRSAVTVGALFGQLTPALGPVTVSQSNVGVTWVVAALDSAKKPTFGLAGRAVEVRPTCVHALPSVEYWPVRFVPSQMIRRKKSCGNVEARFAV